MGKREKRSPAVVRNCQLLRWRGGKNPVADLRETGIVSAGNRAFAGCRYLEEVLLPETFSAVKIGAFRNCPRVKRVDLPAGNNVGVGAGSFENCHRLAKIGHAELISSVGDRAFAGCHSLAEFSFGAELTRIGERAFADCVGLTCLSLPRGIASVGEETFLRCTELARVDLSDLRAPLAIGMFRDCISLSEILFPSQPSLVLPPSVFRGCSALESVRVPGNVEKIGASAFRDCRRLTSVVMESGVTEIAPHAFDGCASLTEITLPRTLAKIGFRAFGSRPRSAPPLVLHTENQHLAALFRRLLVRSGVKNVTVAE